MHCRFWPQENALDPSHASYVHNRVISRREDAAPMRMRLSSEVDAQRGFELAHGGYSQSQQAGGMRARRWFVPPCTIRRAAALRLWRAAPALQPPRRGTSCLASCKRARTNRRRSCHP